MTSVIDRQNSTFLTYSYRQASTDLVRLVTTHSSSYQMMIGRLSEYVCKIHVETSSTIDEIREQMQQSTAHYRIRSNEQKRFSDALHKVDDICRRTQKWIETNQEKNSQVQKFSEIKKEFERFSDYLQLLRKQWNGYLKKNGQEEHRYHSTSSFSSSRAVRSRSHRHHETKRTSRRQESSPPRLTSNVRQHVIPQVTDLPKDEEKIFDEEKHLFYQSLNTELYQLTNISRCGSSKCLHPVAELVVDELQMSLSNVRLSDCLSLIEGVRAIDIVRHRLLQTVENQHCTSPSEEKKQSFVRIDQMLEWFGFFMSTKASQANTGPLTKAPEQSTPNSRLIMNDDDKSSDVSSSSVDDDTLLQTAAQALEQLTR